MLCVVTGKHSKAMDYFDAAIEGAAQNGATQDEAVAKELAAGLYAQRGRDKMAHSYLKESYYTYMKWNCFLKTQNLDARIEKGEPRLLSGRTASGGLSWEPSLSLSSSLESPQSTFTATFSGSSELLDLSTVVKASQALLGKNFILFYFYF